MSSVLAKTLPDLTKLEKLDGHNYKRWSKKLEKENNAQPNERERSIFERFNRHQPPVFMGVTDPVILEGWIREMEKLFVVTHMPEEEKVDMASYYFREEADRWWDLMKESLKAQPGFGWDQFKESVKARFYPESLRWKKQQEFLDLEQGDMTVEQYTSKFIELARFASMIIPTEREKIRRYELRLAPKVRTAVAAVPSRTFQEAYDRALSVYDAVLDQEAHERRLAKKTPAPSSSSQGPAKRVKHGNTSGEARSNPAPQGDRRCYHCGGAYHPGKSCSGKDIRCFNCQGLGHTANRCPQRTNQASGVGNMNNRSQQAPAQGRVFLMNRVEAEAHPDVLTGTFLANSTPAFVIFDTGASLSFISTSFVSKTQLIPSAPITTTISLPTGEIIPCSTVFRDVPISIGGTNFTADLISFKLSGFDIILGMDWLARFDAKFICRDQKIILKSPLGTRVSYKSISTKPGIKWVSALKLENLRRKGYKLYLCSIRDVTMEVKIDDIPIVREYTDVFPEDLPGVPPERDIEFNIDLLPGAGPISKAPYRMAPAEMQELKKQLDDLIEKGFIRPSVSPWGAPVLFVRKKDGNEQNLPRVFGQMCSCVHR
ncbi:uncharacterized protein LOC141655015 [Silene latifolia]|uniref:uncharacterized protein LOC141655015 n=1 Tax=Silene latifolia TaxID=37657 RepID=UPI003D78142C